MADRSQQVLSSWKEIAAFFGKGIRTVQRWERDLQLPVYRPNSNDKAPVLAFCNELEKWSRSRKIPPNPEFKTQQVRMLLEELHGQVKCHREEIKRLREQTEQLKQLWQDIELQLQVTARHLKSEHLKGTPRLAHFKAKSVQ
jgi:hypothetical protein